MKNFRKIYTLLVLIAQPISASAAFLNIDEEFKKAEKLMGDLKREQSLIERHFASIQKTIDENKQVIGFQVNEEAYTTKSGKSVYEVSVKLPDFEKSNIKVWADKQNKQAQALSITAQKSVQPTAEVTTKDDAHAVKVSEWHSEHFASSRSVNNRKQTVNYKDGSLTITVDLPNNIAVDDYSMSFENNELKVIFPIKSSEETRTHFEFSDTKNEN